MKNSKVLLKILPLVCAFFIGSAAFAQSNQLTIVNSTDCTFEFVITASDCDDGCTLGPVCVGPGTTLINPCGSTNFEWNSADVVAVDANCEDCGGGSATVERAVGAGCGSTVSPNILACDPCGTVNVTFSTANQINIF